ncbi:porin [Geotalea uraniireducens]|uniref:Phosphate-selective porin O and P n=1 Tax=Geotalea uraniireducens (strain Rf4) TaxID=351605 RepID=A5G6R8_GEOUR|nr:porin [Geotalea uraniireducens]ABQ27486.1 phosphate-selective porin O and P [Geotalea uraniireducens Rf4]
MKKTMTTIGIVAAILGSQVSFAKTLEDVLKEKGVITEEDYKAVTRSKSLDYKLGEGFVFTSPDEKFRTAIGSSFQIRYAFMDLDNANNTTANKAQDSSRFELRRIKLFFNGYAFTRDLAFKLVLNFANSQNPPTTTGLLEETWMNYRLLDEAQLRFGQDKVQFGRQFITSSTALQFVDLSVVTIAFVPGYDTGLMIHGKIAGGLVNYNVAGYGGLGQNTFRTTSDNAFAARLTVNPFGDVKYSESDVEYSRKPLVSLGADFFRDTVNGSETNNLNFFGSKGWYGIGNPLLSAARRISTGEAIDFNTAGIDAVFKWLGCSAQGEYFIGQADGQTTKNTLRAQGFYTQAGYFVIPKKLEFAARYAYLDPNRDVADDHWIETTGAISWYINDHNLKLVADYTNIHKQKGISFNNGPNATDDRQVRFQAQMVF